VAEWRNLYAADMLITQLATRRDLENLVQCEGRAPASQSLVRPVSESRMEALCDFVMAHPVDAPHIASHGASHALSRADERRTAAGIACLLGHCGQRVQRTGDGLPAGERHRTLESVTEA